MSLSQKYNALAKQLDNVIEDKSELEQKMQAKAKEIQMLNMKHEEQQKTINVFKHSEV